MHRRETLGSAVLHQELTFAPDAEGCYLEPALAGGECQFKVPEPTWPNRMDAEAAVPCSSLVNSVQ